MHKKGYTIIVCCFINVLFLLGVLYGFYTYKTHQLAGGCNTNNKAQSAHDTISIVVLYSN
jgi:hypothetical protein